MMGYAAIAKGVGAENTENLWAQITTALQGIKLGLPLIGLNQQWIDQIATDSLNYSNDMAASIRDPSKVVNAAQDNVQKDLDQSKFDLQVNSFQNIIETIKSSASYLGQNLDNVFKLAGTVEELLAYYQSLNIV
ncbi:MAG TPA: hypothetical protein VLE95_04595 [Chlamydiales bacterium]|nr:hypothetical protein [Chlamydiales bacterium]